MYGRVGLQTPRGSGTSGYVTQNLSQSKPIRSKVEFLREMKRLKEHPLEPRTEANPEIIEHKRRREVYALLEEEQERLRQKGVGEAEVEELLAVRESELLRNHRRGSGLPQTVLPNRNDAHLMAEHRKKQSERVRTALGIAEDHRTGTAFDFELQERERLERKYLRELRELEALQRQEQVEEEQQRLR